MRKAKAVYFELAVAMKSAIMRVLAETQRQAEEWEKEGASAIP